MKLLFCRSRLPGSYLIRWLTFSKWSHVAVVFEDGWAIEATWPKVRQVRVEEIIARHSAYEFRELDCAFERAWFEAQVGKRYDLSGLFMFLNPWREGWMDDARWFCSELVAAATGLFADNERVSPQFLYLLSRPC